MTSTSRSQNRIATAHHQQQLAMIEAVDEIGRAMDDKWGVGRLPRLVDPLTAARFARQIEKFGQACWGDELGDVAAHAPAMVRAYQALDQLARDAGHQPIPPQQWEFEIPEGLVILVRHTDDIGRAQTHGRQCQIWSLEGSPSWCGSIRCWSRSRPTSPAPRSRKPGPAAMSCKPAPMTSPACRSGGPTHDLTPTP